MIDMPFNGFLLCFLPSSDFREVLVAGNQPDRIFLRHGNQQMLYRQDLTYCFGDYLDLSLVII